MVESTALEMRRAFTGTVGSNPTLSANFWNNNKFDVRARSAGIAHRYFQGLSLCCRRKSTTARPRLLITSKSRSANTKCEDDADSWIPDET